MPLFLSRLPHIVYFVVSQNRTTFILRPADSGELDGGLSICHSLMATASREIARSEQNLVCCSLLASREKD
jgi:hypothetical protein